MTKHIVNTVTNCYEKDEEAIPFARFEVANCHLTRWSKLKNF